MIDLLDITLLAPPYVLGDGEPDPDRDVPTVFASVVTPEDDWPDPARALVEDD